MNVEKIESIRLSPGSYVSAEGVHHYTNVFIVADGRKYYTRLAYPVTDEIYEKAAFLRRAARHGY